MPVISDSVLGAHPIVGKVGSDGSVRLEAMCGATSVKGTAQMLYWNQYGWLTKDLAISTGTATNPMMFYVGVPERAGTTGKYYDYIIGGPAPMLTTAVFRAGSPALLSTGAAVISGTTSLTATGAMAEIGIFMESLPTTAVSTALFKVMLYGLPKYMTS